MSRAHIPNLWSPKESGANQLRALVKWCDVTPESALDQHPPHRLIQLFRAYRLSGWDFTIDRWTHTQRDAALLRGLVPQWDTKTEKPIPSVPWQVAAEAAGLSAISIIDPIAAMRELADFKKQWESSEAREPTECVHEWQECGTSEAPYAEWECSVCHTFTTRPRGRRP